MKGRKISIQRLFMKINKEVLHLPPHISTSWNNISSIFSKGTLLIILLKNGLKIEITDLNPTVIKNIFDAHAEHLVNKDKPKTSISFGLPLAGGLPNSLLTNPNMESLSSVMQHDPNQKNAPDLPPDLLKKISTLAKIFTEETNSELPVPEQNCNCMHCQIAKAMQIGAGKNIENLDEEVSDEDLKFRVWDIKEEGNKLFSVTNPLDKNEHYNVFLGSPIGCTCGKKNCEHIKAVLKS